jgi:CBS domain-containing protein
VYRFLEARVGDYMARDVVTVPGEVTIGELERLFDAHGYEAFPVADDGRLVGIVTRFDVLRVFLFRTDRVVPQYEELAKRSAGEVMTPAAVTFAPDEPLTRVLQALVERRVKSFPVLDTDGSSG